MLYPMLVLSAALTIATVPSSAEPALLTLTGEIGKQNRGPSDDFDDALFDKLGISFERGYQFTYSALKALPQASITVSYENWPRQVSVSGPLLRDVLAAADAAGDRVTVRAIDGYAPEFSFSDIEKGQFVLAIEADGKPLSIGGRGPVWLVFPKGTLQDQADTDDDLSWAAFHIEIR